MYTVTRHLPDGTVKTQEATSKRNAGQLVAWCLHDNTTMDKKTATKHGIEAEKTGTTSANGYTFTITTS